MIDDLYQNLTSAQSELARRFGPDAEALHLAVSIVFSSILKKNRLPCIIVGGQSASYWMRVPGSIDVDFVSPSIDKIATVLEQCGFVKSPDCSFRYVHTETNVLIELVGERVDVAGMKSGLTVTVEPGDIEDPLVRSLMPGPAEVLDPAVVFVNYCNSSDHASIWYDYENGGALAVERARTLFALYEGYIRNSLKSRYETGEISETFLQLLRDKFLIVL